MAQNFEESIVSDKGVLHVEGGLQGRLDSLHFAYASEHVVILPFIHPFAEIVKPKPSPCTVMSERSKKKKQREQFKIVSSLAIQINV